jgi:mannose-6-phosphate isomerase-like protein (cupin superfamily)
MLAITVAKAFAVGAIASLLSGCRGDSTGAAAPQQASAGPRPAVIGPHEGERRFLRGGTAPLLIKIDPVTTGSRRMVLGSSDLPPGDAIRTHRHLREDEILLVTRGTARVQLGTKLFTAGPGTAVFIPQRTCIAVENVGADTLTNIFIFSSPGFEQVLREVSSLEGAPPKRVSPEERAAAFHRGHADAGPKDC